MTAQVYFFDVSGYCSYNDIYLKNVIDNNNGNWLNEPYKIGSIYYYVKCKKLVICAIAYQSVHLNSFVNFEWWVLFKYLSKLFNIKMYFYYISNFNSHLKDFENTKSYKNIQEKILLKDSSSYRVY